MKQTFTHLLSILLTACLWQAAEAQTVTTNPESWSTLVPSGTCTSCTITIPTGYTLNLNSTGTCDGCTFTGGGTVNMTAAFKFPNNTTTFNNLTVFFNAAPGSLKNLDFSNDSIAVNSALTYSSGPTTITNSRISVNAAFKFQTATLNGDSIHLNSTMSFSGSTDVIQNSHVDMANGSSLSMQTATTSGSVFSLVGNAALSTSGNLTSSADSFYMAGSSTVKNSSAGSFTNDVFSLSGTSGFSNSSGMTVSGGSISTYNNSTFKASSSFSSTNTNLSFNDNSVVSFSSNMSVTGGNVTLNGSAQLKASSSVDVEDANVKLNGNTLFSVSSTLTLGTGSDLIIGDNTGTSTAHVTTSGLSVTGNSFLGIAAGGNSIKVSSGSFNNDHGSVTIGSGAITGCGTLNNSGSNTCVVLAIADLSLTVHADDGKPALSWTDKENTIAGHYQVQRNTGGLDWTTITSIDADTNPNEIYRFTDDDAPTGTVYYRIVRIEVNGNTLYSSVSAVTVAAAGTGTTVGIHPNPVVGSTFYVTTSNMGQLIINVFTMTGQLLIHTEANGQTQYAVHLPSQTAGSGAVVVQTIIQGVTKSFTVLVR